MRKFFSFRCLLAAVALAAGTGAEAYDFEYQGLCYNILSTDEKTVEVASDGDETFYDELQDLVIPETVTYDSVDYKVVAIGEYAFQYTPVTSASMPASVATIGDGAFQSCGSLAEIGLPAFLTAIGNEVFYECISLDSINIPSTVTAIGDGAFYGCSGLTTVVFPESLETIGQNAFHGCSSLTSVELPNSLVWISYSAFSSCTGLKSVVIPNTVETIDGNAFAYCSSLETVEIPESVTELGEGVFNECTSLTSAKISAQVTALYEMFRNCTSLAYVELPSTLTILSNTFFGCSGLEEIELPNTLEVIGEAAFFMTGLKSIELPSSVTNVGSNAFLLCENLASIKCYPTAPPSAQTNAFDEAYYNATLYVPAGCKDDYEAHVAWGQFNKIEEMTATGVDNAVSTDGEGVSISVENGVILVSGAAGEVSVYTLGGAQVYGGKGGLIGGLPAGVYVVKAGGKTQKVAL